MRIRFVCLSTVGCMLLGTCLYVGTTHVHDYHVMGKELVSVRPGYTHEYISSTITDPITGVETPIYSTCNVLRDVYQGTYTCIVEENNILCGDTLPEPYLWGEDRHTSCNKK